MIPTNDITNPTLERLIEYAHNEIEGFNIEYKDISMLMKILGALSPWNPRFMSDFTTTVGTTMYVPRKDFMGSQELYLEIVAHELVHMRESKKQGALLYFLRYFFPQNLALLALFAIGAVWSPWFLLALAFLACLAPLPAPGRRDIELSGYVMTLCVRYWSTQQLLETDFTWASREFTGAAYYFMWPWSVDIMRRLKAQGLKIRTEAILADSMFREISTIIRRKR